MSKRAGHRPKTESPRRPEEGGNPISRWRYRRRLMRESKLLAREARRILKRFRARIREEVAEETGEVLAALDKARGDKDYRRVRERAEKLDEILDRQLAFGRKSALREYAESIGIAVLIALVLRAFVVEAFKIPSGSMIPTLKVGDHLFVNKFIYGLRIPWTDIKFFSRKPERGSVVVFVFPHDPDKDFIKRIVAVGGDTIEVRDEVVYVNDKPVPRRKLTGSCKYVDGDEESRDWQLRECVGYQERLGGHTYRVIQDVDSVPIDYKKIKVPEGFVFVMGDNRDNSHDSRAWPNSPFVPLANIKGKALIIWWSSGEPDGIRWSRFFDRVHHVPEGPDIKP